MGRERVYQVFLQADRLTPLSKEQEGNSQKGWWRDGFPESAKCCFPRAADSSNQATARVLSEPSRIGVQGLNVEGSWFQTEGHGRLPGFRLW